MVDKIGAQARGKADAEGERTRAPLKAATEPAPSTATAPRTAADLAVAPIGAQPKDIDAGRAVPPERPASQVEGVIDSNKQTVDAKMKELGVPDPETTLRTSNEPSMVGAVEAKGAFDADATAAPGDFRKAETDERAAAKTENAGAGTEAIGTMFASRTGLIGKVQKGQHGGKAKSVSQLDVVKGAVNKIYEDTKGEVQKILTGMQKEVFEKFDTKSKEAMSEFENGVVDAEKRWNEKNIFSRTADQVASFITRLPTELEGELRLIRLRFIIRMSLLIREIAQIVTQKLKAAKDEVKKGRDAIKVQIDSLPGDQEKLKAELTKEFDGKFNALEGDIKAAREDVVKGVAKRYKDTLAASDKLLSDVRERNKSFLDKFADKIGGVIAMFTELKAKLETVFQKAKGAILLIVADPVGFLKRLFAGIGLGFQKFGNNILKHLVQGAVAWLTGAVQSAGIVLPERFDAAGILSVFLQITGLTIENVMARARVIWGDKVVDAILLGVAGAEKAIELFQIFKTEGVMGLVRVLKEKIIELKDAALDKIKGAIQVTIVEAAIKFLLGLLTPVGALVTAVIKIVDTVLFFIRNASRLADLISAIVDGVNDVLSGNVGGLAVKVENALAAAVPIVLDFLASLLGIGAKIVETIKNVIAFIRKPVEQAIDFMLTGIKNLLGPVIARVMGAFGMGPKPAAAAPQPGAPGVHPPGAPPPGAHPPEAAPPPPPGAIGTTVPFAFDGQSHTLFLRQTDLQLMVSSSNPEDLDSFVKTQPVSEDKKGQVLQTKSKAEREAKAAKQLIEKEPGKGAAITHEGELVQQDETQIATLLSSEDPWPEELEPRSDFPRLNALNKQDMEDGKPYKKRAPFRYFNDFDKEYEGEQPLHAYIEQRAARKLGRRAEAPALAEYANQTALGAIAGLSKNRLTLEVEQDDGPPVERIPDLFRDGVVVGDIKNTKKVDLDAQMRDNVQIKAGNALLPSGKRVKPIGEFHLLVRFSTDANKKATHVSAPLLNQLTRLPFEVIPPE